MTKVLKHIIFVIFTTIISSCAYKYYMPRHIKKKFKYKYSSQNKNLSSLINTDGYYTQIEILKDEQTGKLDTVYVNYLFFSDGVFLKEVEGADGSICLERLPKYLTKISKNPSEEDSLLGQWGTYIISGDTIKTQSMHSSKTLNDSWYGFEDHFKVVDKNTIRMIYRYPMHEIPMEVRKIHSKKFFLNSIAIKPDAIFIKTDALPPSDNWMKNEKWYWEDENEYNEYIQKKLTKNNHESSL